MQIFKGTLYRKLVTWKDLDIHIGDYAPIVECDTLKLLENLEEQLRYLPTKLEYEPITFDDQGSFSYETSGDEEIESTKILSATVKHFIDMEQLIHQNYLMSSETAGQFLNNNNKQITLRKKFELISQQLQEAENKNRDLLSK